MANQEATIYKALDEIIGYTTSWLAQLFELPADIPSLCGVLTSKTCYHPTTNTINLSLTHLHRNSSIAHEAGHYLHGLLNPEIYSLYGHSMEETNHCELVAQYGALLFSKDKHPFIEKKRKQILDTLKLAETSEEEFQEIELSEDEYSESFSWHEGGCSAAEFLSNNYGQKYLSSFARLNTASAKELLLRLGWRRPLFVPYEDRSKEYE